MLATTWQSTADMLLFLLPGGLFTLWCLFGINWCKAWPVLAAGGWIPLVLVAWMTAYIWSLVNPRPITVAGIRFSNYWWHILAVVILTGVGLFSGWLQTVYGWEPATVSLDPPEDHGHGHDDHDHH